MADSSGWQKALYRVRPQLEEKVNVEHIISSLHEAVPGGFLTSREEKDIVSQTLDFQKVRRLVEILATKDEKAFNTFVALLKTIGQEELADELESAAKEGQPKVVDTCTTSQCQIATPPKVPAQKSNHFPQDMTDKPPSDVQKHALTTLTQRNPQGDKLFRILVVGEPGSGKSTLVQNLFGVEVKGKRGELCEHSVAPEGCRLVLYISYGVQEDTEKHFGTIKQMVHDDSLSLIIYCCPMNSTRLRERFFDTFKKHNEIGVKWDKSLLALTFVDALPVPRQERKLPHFDSGTFFLKKKEDWVRELKRHLLPESASNAIHIHSTTEHSTVCLPSGRDWYAPLWDDILDLLLQPTTNL